MNGPKYHINVNAIAPGYMATDNTAPLRQDAKRSEEILQRIPAGRWGMPADLQGVAVFLASEASRLYQRLYDRRRRRVAGEVKMFSNLFSNSSIA